MVIAVIESLSKRRDWWLLTIALCEPHAKVASSYDAVL
jgi:hypothetical protein